jgi:serine/threonine protein kinase
MDFVSTILFGLAGGIATQAGRSLYDWLKDTINATFSGRSEANVVKALDEIGNLADSDIRKRVQEFARQQKLAVDQAEELTNLLINLAHGGRFHSTHGTLRSSFVRCERLLDQLLQKMLPKRKKGEPVAADAMPDWQLTRFLGMGSFGEVWEAQNPAHPEPRAVKFFTSLDAQQWIKAEQQTLFHVQKTLPAHPNLIKFIDVALSAKPFPYLLLEYANAGSLEEWILRQPKDRKPLDKQRVMEGIVRGLAQAHEQGIAHRDLKPANIMLSGNIEVVPKIADFGLGKVNQVGSGNSSAGQGVVVGSSLYLPPEAYQPFAKRVPEQDDVFAIGVIWYQLLVERLERPPYDFTDRLKAHLADSQTIRVIERCLAHPERRFTDAGELDEDMPAPVPIIAVPPDCFDVQYLAREYLASKA